VKEAKAFTWMGERSAYVETELSIV